MKNPFPKTLLPLRVVERQKDGSVYIEGGSRDSHHIAFDVGCSPAEAQFLVYALNEVARMADPKTEAPGKEWCIFVEDSVNDMGSCANSVLSAVQNLVAILGDLEDGETVEMTIKRKDMTPAELVALPEI